MAGSRKKFLPATKGKPSSVLPVVKKTPEKPKGPPSFQDHNDIITVIVGANKTKFSAHKGFLVHYSKYFDKCLNGNFQEAAAGVVTLDDPDVSEFFDPDVFALFMEWVYSRNITIKLPQTETDGTFTRETPTYDLLAKLWILADYLQAPECQNLVVDRIIDTVDDSSYYSLTLDVDFLYKHTVDSMPLRKLFVELFCTLYDSGTFSDEELRSELSMWPKEALLDFCVIRSLPKYGELCGPDRCIPFYVPV